MTSKPILFRAFISLLFFMIVWLFWSGFFKPLLIGLGLFSCTLVVVLSLRMGSFEKGREWLHLLPRFPAFWFWLSKEIVKSNIKVARVILSRRPVMSPTLITIDILPPDAIGQAILGNCVTLTPGSLTLNDQRGKLRAHCLTYDVAQSLAEGEMNRRVEALTRH